MVELNENDQNTHTQTQKKSKYKHNLTNTKGSQSDAKLFKSEKQKKRLWQTE